MEKMRLGITLCFLSLLIGCSNNEVKGSSKTDYAVQIDELKKENQSLKDELLSLNSDYSVYLQQLDSTSRNIIRKINEKQYDQLKTNYNVKFEVTDGEIIFITPDNVNSAGFPIEQANLPMSIAYLNIQSERLELGYYLDNLDTDERFSITFVYDKNKNFQYIFVGDI